MDTFTKATIMAGFASLITLSTSQLASAASADMTEAPAAPTLQSTPCGTLGPQQATQPGTAQSATHTETSSYLQSATNGTIGPYANGATNGTIGPQTPEETANYAPSYGNGAKTLGQPPCRNSYPSLRRDDHAVGELLMQLDNLKGKVSNSVTVFVQSIQDHSRAGKAIVAPQGYVVSSHTAMPMTPMPLLP